MISQEPSQNALLQGKWILLYRVRQQLLAQLLAIHVQGVHDTRTRLVYSLHVDKRKAIAIYHNQKKKTFNGFLRQYVHSIPHFRTFIKSTYLSVKPSIGSKY